MLEILLGAALLQLCLVHLTAYAIRWVIEGRLREDKRSLFDAPLSGALSILLEIAASAAIITLSAADLILSVRKFPFARRKPQTAPPPEAKKQTPAPREEIPPVILLHGAGMRGLSMYPIARKLRREGRVVYMFTYWPPGLAFEAYARQLRDYLESLRKENGYETFDAVGHSVGGLILRRYLALYPGSARIRRLVTIGTPHGGSELWRFAPKSLGRQLRPGGEFLTRLDAAPPPPGAELIAISSDFDQLVVPNENARWEADAVANHAVENSGHARLIFHGEAWRILRRALF
jgi:pimeloyl-ACP methyl ester carboxylesterase